ncbi:transcriptional regulator [Bacillus sp. UMB0899]|nr:transcriptional regulator [Bacillus sp. UMB0899]
MSQKELAEGICTQAQISKLEAGHEIPYSNTLYELSKKLGVDMNYFFDSMQTSQLDYVAEVKNLINDYKRKRDYRSIHNLINKHKNSPLFNNLYTRQFLEWHEVISNYYLKKATGENVISRLHEIINHTRSKDNFFTEQEIEILISIAIIYNEEKEFKMAEYKYIEAMNHLQKLPQLQNNQIYIRICYGLSRNYGESEKYDQSKKWAEKGINSCIQYESFYLLGELYYMVGWTLLKKEKKEVAIPYMENAIYFFSLTKNDAFVKFVKDEIEKL